MTRLTTARWTGVFYLVLAIAGFVGFLLVRSQLLVESDATATAANLVEQASLARLGIGADLTVVLAQALAAVGFYKLFREDNGVASASIAGFGLVNAVAILVATALSATALVVAGDASLAPSGDQAATIQVLYELSGALWDIGGLFFGLWLVPMGFVVVETRAMPSTLGWVLILGGIGYVVSTYLSQMIVDVPSAIEASLVGLATLGEFWMIGYLLLFGIRGREPSAVGAG
jgi:hypothetical protein